MTKLSGCGVRLSLVVLVTVGPVGVVEETEDDCPDILADEEEEPLTTPSWNGCEEYEG